MRRLFKIPDPGGSPGSRGDHIEQETQPAGDDGAAVATGRTRARSNSAPKLKIPFKPKGLARFRKAAKTVQAVNRLRGGKPFVHSHQRLSRRAAELIGLQHKRTGEDLLKIVPFDAFIILPDAPFRIAWDTLMFALVIYYAIVVPVRISFDIAPKYSIAEHMFTSFFFLDMAINFNTAIQRDFGHGRNRKGKYITSRREIARQYIRLWFWIDMMDCGEDLFANFTGGNVAGLGRRLGNLAKLMRLFKASRLIKQWSIPNNAK